VDIPETVADAVRLLAADGYSGEFSINANAVHCGACERACEPSRVVISRTYRFEGNTDPADEAIVLGLECPDCGVRGVLVSAYGPDADAALLALVEHLAD
jgi:ferredoxin